VHDLAGRVGQDLDLDVPGAEHGPLQEDRRVTEGAGRLAHGGPEGGRQVAGGLDPAHAAPSAAGHRLHEQGEADVRSGRKEHLDVGRRFRRREDRDPRLPGRTQGSDLVARHLQHLGRRPDEGDAGLGARTSELRVLRQEAVARVHGVRLGLPGHPDDLGDVQVGPDRMTGLPDRVGLVGLQPVLGVAVLVREDRDRARAKLDRGPETSDSDLCAVGDEHLGEHELTSWSAGREAER